MEVTEKNILEDNDEKKLALLLNELKLNQKDQFDSIDSLDNKTGIVLGFVIIFVINLLNSNWFLRLQNFLIFPVLLGFIIAIYLCLLVLMVKSFDKGTDSKKLFDLFFGTETNSTSLLNSLILSYKTGLINNTRSKIDCKKKYINCVFVTLFITIIFLCYIFIFFR